VPDPSTGASARPQGVATPPPEALLDSRRCGHCGRTIPDGCSKWVAAMPRNYSALIWSLLQVVAQLEMDATRE
jgi:hypothetical protein